MGNLRNIKYLFATIIHRFHMVIFIVAVVTSLSVAVLLLNGIILKTNGTGPAPDSEKPSFDQATIDRVKQLRTSGESGTGLDLSKGRISPFSE